MHVRVLRFSPEMTHRYEISSVSSMFMPFLYLGEINWDLVEEGKDLQCFVFHVKVEFLSFYISVQNILPFKDKNILKLLIKCFYIHIFNIIFLHLCIKLESNV